MDFAISEKMRVILEMIREFMQKEVYPLEPLFVKRSFREMLPELEKRRRMVKQMELWAPQAPREIGGVGLSLTEHAMVSEELGKSPIGHFVFGCQAPDAGNIEILHLFGTPEQKEQYLLPLVRGEIRSCFSMTEPDCPGSNPTEMECTAVKDGDDYVINGHKWFTSSAEGSSFAIVMAVTNPENPPHLRASQIIVPMGTPGFEILRNIPVMGHVGDDYASHGEVIYRSCRVPRRNLLGQEGHGFIIAQERLGPGRIHHCMRWIGICERAFDLMCRRASERRIAGDKTLATRQIVQAWIAECRARIQAARLMVLHAAWKIEQEGQHAAREEVSLIKFFVADVMLDVINKAIQVHGALGVTDDTLLSFFYRNERASRIYDGPDEVHKVVVARRILRSYASGQGGNP
ncbi:MAG: acyl-CoA dehydrogenase family protein [bacterium]